MADERQDIYPSRNPKELDLLNANIAIDNLQAITSETMGVDRAEKIKKWMNQHNKEIPVNAKFLGLGAGMAFPEIAMAHELGIKGANITLLDKKFTIDAKMRIQNKDSSITRIERGLFDYLHNPPEGEKFFLVTAFGIENLFLREEQVSAFITVLPNVLQQGGFVSVFPPNGTIEKSSLWEKNSFEEIRLGLYTFKNHGEALQTQPPTEK